MNESKAYCVTVYIPQISSPLLIWVLTEGDPLEKPDMLKMCTRRYEKALGDLMF